MDRRLVGLPLLVAALLGLAACATTGDERGWVGASYDEVVQRWGQPQDSSRLADGTDVYLWISESPAVSQSGATIGFGGFGGRGSVGTGVGVQIPIPVGPAPEPQRCERRLYVRDGVVTDEEWLGSDSACRLYRRH